MEPETSAPKLGPEQAPIEYGKSLEHVQKIAPQELGIERGAEAVERTADLAAAAAGSAAQATILPEPVIIDNTVTNAAAPALTSSPLTAKDDDLIEKEWVDKAKKIVAETRDDPYRREEAVSQLQKDYQNKRYGRDLGDVQ